MDELKLIYAIILAVWKLFKKYGTGRLDDEQWKSLIEESNALGRRAKQNGEEYYLLFHDLWLAQRCFYQRKETDGQK